jgi:hypothetical protein
MCLHYILFRFTHSIFFHSLSFIVPLWHTKKYVYHNLPLTFPLPSPFTAPHQWWDIFYLPVHFCNCIFIVKCIFSLIFQTCIYCVLLRSIPFILFSIVLTPNYSKTYLVFQSIFSYIYAMCFNIFHSLRFFHTVLPPTGCSDNATQSCYHSIFCVRGLVGFFMCLCLWVSMCVYIHTYICT